MKEFKLEDYKKQLEPFRYRNGILLNSNNYIFPDIEVENGLVDASAHVSENFVEYEDEEDDEERTNYCRVTFDYNKIISYDCRCKDFHRIQQAGHKYPCKHIVALMNATIDTLNYNIESYEPYFSKINSLVLLSNNTYEVETITNFDTEYSIRPYLEISRWSGTNIGFKIGADKFYFIKYFREFIANLDSKSYFSYGKNLSLVHNIEYFDKESQKTIGLMRDFIETNSDRSVSNSRILLRTFGQKKYTEVLRNAKEIELKNDSKTRVLRRVDELNKKNDLLITYKKDGCTFLIKRNIDSIRFTHFMIEIDDNCYSIVNDDKYKFTQNFDEMFSSYDSENTCTLGPEDTRYMVNFVLANLNKYYNVKEEKISLKPKTIVELPNLAFYLDYVDKHIMVEFKIDSNGSVFDYADSNLVNNLSDSLCTSLFENYLKPYIIDETYDNKYILNDDNDEVVSFLDNILPKLYEFGDVYASDAFKKINVIKRIKVTSHVKVLSNMLDLSIDVDGINKDELYDVFNSYRNKVKYHRLKDGSLINTYDNEIKDIYDLYNNLEIDEKSMMEGNFILPKYRSLYLDKLLSDMESNSYSRDDIIESLVNNFDNVTNKITIPKTLSKILRPYQIEGVNWLGLLDEYNFGGILADDMGLGKTLQVITFLLARKLDNKLDTSLIVTPASLLYNWESEFKKFAPEINVLIIEGTKSIREELMKDYNKYDVVITSYDLLRSDIILYKNIEFQYHIIDEAQYIKNNNAQLSKAIKLITSKQRYALTGTPIENRLSELWSIFDFIMPKYLYGYDHFRKKLETPITKYNDSYAATKLVGMVRPFIMRRLKKDVLKELPDKLEKVVHSKFDDTQQKLYDAHVLNVLKLFQDQKESEFNQNKIAVFAELTKLRQICCDPTLIYKNYKGDSSKLKTTLDLIESGIEGNHKMLLFSQFTSMLDIIEDKLKILNINYHRIDGTTSKLRRIQLVNAFNSDETPIFLISLKAGGTGLNLTSADIVIHYDPWWNVAVTNQATDRSHRIGQKNTVTVYKVVCENTIEEKILSLQDKKQELADQIINNETNNLSKLTKDDFLKLFDE